MNTVQPGAMPILSVRGAILASLVAGISTAIAGPARAQSALPTEGPVAAWGWSQWGQLGVPGTLSTFAGAASGVAVGDDHGCAIEATSGEVVCWGFNVGGTVYPPSAVNGDTGTASAIDGGQHLYCALQSGTGNAVCWGVMAQAPPPSVNGTTGTATALSVGGAHACAIQSGTQAAVCWGNDAEGQSSVPASVDGTGGTALAVSAGWHHSCAIQAGSRAVVCWGSDASGAATPPPAVNGTAGTADAIATAFDMSCAIQRGSGAVICWGDALSTPPASVNGTAGNAIAIDASGLDICAIQAGTGAVICWGSTSLQAPPIVNGADGSATTLAVGNRNACAIHAGTGTVACWGTPADQALAPAFRVKSWGTARAISAGNEHSCAIESVTGAVQCWGSNGLGQSTVPTSLNGIGGSATSLSSSGNHSCAVRSIGSAVVCWGDNWTGQLDAPASVNGASGTALRVAAGQFHSCAIQSGTNRVICWGYDGWGQASPPLVGGAPLAASAIEAGTYHTCALRRGTGAVVCWGYGFDGQTTVPPSVSGATGTATAVSAGFQHSCAIQAGSGAVVCWGANQYGQSAPPPSVNGTSGSATAIAVGDRHSCAIQSGTGAAICWGDDGFDQVSPPPGLDGSEGPVLAIAAGQHHVVVIRAADCADELDDDGDGATDHANDAGCAGPNDFSERSPQLPCDDGFDNDGDGVLDHVPGGGDPGCQLATSALENPKCDDGLDNDGDGGIDWDGAPPDPQCTDKPWRDRETPSSSCGFGGEIAGLLLLLRALRRSSLRSSSRRADLMRGLSALVLAIATTAVAPAVHAQGAPKLTVALGSYAASATNDAQTGTTDYDLGVIPVAHVFTVDTCDAPAGTTYLRIVDEAGATIAAGSGGCPGGGTRLSAVSTATARYTARAGCAGEGACSGRVTASSEVGMVERWAPVVYQDTQPGNYFVPGDYITNFNFDGDYDGSNNFNNADRADEFPFDGHVYYSHVETRTHDFVAYYFFHPQDRSCDLDQHENDLEGVLLAIRKGGLFGEVIAMQAEAHGRTYQYVTPGLGTTESPAGTAPDGAVVLLGDVEENPRSDVLSPMPYLMAGHPKVYSEAGGHGVFSCDDNGNSDVNCGDNDGVVYAWQGGDADDPQANECANGKQESVHFDLLAACGYRLVSLDDWGGSRTVADPGATQGFWVLQNHICRNCTFHSFTNFRGNGSFPLDDDGEILVDPCGDSTGCSCSDNAANAPWQWRDHDGTGSGDWLSDPARMFDIDFEGPEFEGARFSHEYTRHPYYTHEIEIRESRLFGSPVLENVPVVGSHVFTRSLPPNGSESNAIDGYHWRMAPQVLGVWLPWSYGGDDAAAENEWSQPNLRSYRFTRQTQVLLPDGTFENGGRSIEVGLAQEVPSSFGPTPIRVFSTVLEPDDWASGSCPAVDDEGCERQPGVYGNCRVQVNDFTCGEGAAGPAGNVAFKLTRIQRPSAPPVAVAGPDHVIECTSPAGTPLQLDATGSGDPENDPITYRWSAPGVVFDDPTAAAPSALFPLGATVVTLAVSDGTQETIDTAVVTVNDTIAPSLTVALAPAVLSPPDHRLVDVVANVTVLDACSATAPVALLTAVTSSEPDDGAADGNTTNDIQGAALGTPDTAFQLRAERSARGSGRVYTARYSATDAQGNTVAAIAQATVPISACGVGAELGLAIPLLWRLRRRRSHRP